MQESKKQLTPESIQRYLDASPFGAVLGLRVESVDHAAQSLSLTMPANPQLMRRDGTDQFHGGPVAAFIDIAGDFAVGMLLGGGVPTINMRVDYLRPCSGAELNARAQVRRIGRTVAVADVEVSDVRGVTCALGRATYAVVVG